MARMIRDWTDSEKVHKLSAEAERFFTRLIMKADDYGRYIADPRLLSAYLFPLHDTLNDETTKLWLKECIDAELIHVYDVNGKQFLEIHMYDQKLKVRRSKYPPSNGEDQIALSEGYVYVIGTSFDDPVKIGFSVNPWGRLKEISANHPEKIKILLTFKALKRTESLIHLALKSVRTKNEWFKLSEKMQELLINHSKGLIDKDSLLVELRSNSVDNRSSPELEVELEEKREQELEQEGRVVSVFNKIKDFYGFQSEINYAAKWFEIRAFLKRVSDAKQLNHLIIQLDAYIAYKAKTGEKKHSFNAFIEGGWNAENWVEKLANVPVASKPGAPEKTPTVYKKPDQKQETSEERYERLKQLGAVKTDVDMDFYKNVKENPSKPMLSLGDKLKEQFKIGG